MTVAPIFPGVELLAALRALAEPTRLRIFALCAQADLTTSDLTEILGQSQPRVSRHLKILGEAELLERMREGTFAFYRLPAHGIGAELAARLLPLYAQPPADSQALDSIKQKRQALASSLSLANAAQLASLRRHYPPEAQIDKALLRALPLDNVRDLLDIGTGTGHMLSLFGPRVTHAMGIDLSRDMLNVARANLMLADLPHCRLQQADMYHLPLPEASFDAVTIHHVLHFAEHPAQVIAEAARMLRASGRLVVVDFLKHQEQGISRKFHHRWPGFDLAELQSWCQAAGLVLHGEEIIRSSGKPLAVIIATALRPAALQKRKRA